MSHGLFLLRHLGPADSRSTTSKKSALWGGCLQLWALPTITCTYSPKVQHAVQRHIIVALAPCLGATYLCDCARVLLVTVRFLAPNFVPSAQSSITFARTTTHIIVLLLLNYVACQIRLPQIPSYSTPNYCHYCIR